MIGLSFDTELNRDIGVGYVGRKTDIIMLFKIRTPNQPSK